MSRIWVAAVTVVGLAVLALWLGLTALETLTGVIIAVVMVVLFYRLALGRAAQHRNQAAAQRRRIYLRLKPGPGYANLAELHLRWSRKAAVLHGKRSRPDLGGLFTRWRTPATQYAVRLGRAQYWTRVWGRLEDNTLILSPPRRGKSGLVADEIMNHPGAVLCTSTRADLFDLTAGWRATLGPIEVFNPYGIGNVPSTFGWNPILGCEDAATAARRAQAFMGSLTEGDMGFWEDRAAVAMAALLHAAALAPAGTVTMTDVYAWANKRGTQKATEILAAHPGRTSEALAAGLVDVMTDNSKPGQSIRMTMGKGLSWITIPSIAASVADGAHNVDPATFARRCGTLYLIAPGDDGSPIAPLFRAFTSFIHQGAALAGSRMPARKLDPPMLFALDEVTQICPVPLPQWMADSAGKGIRLTVVIHNLGQLEDQWSATGARVVWETAGTKILLPGISDKTTLETVSFLLGEVTVSRGDRRDNIRIVPPVLIRRLPDWRALVVSGNLSPVVVKFRPAWKRHFSQRVIAPPILTDDAAAVTTMAAPLTVTVERADETPQTYDWAVADVPAVEPPPVIPVNGIPVDDTQPEPIRPPVVRKQ